MTLRGAKDVQRTREAQFLSPKSYWTTTGKLCLAGKDWKAQCLEVVERDKHACRGCEKPFWDVNDWFDVHHVLHRGKGGGDDQGNLMLLCRDCHEKRHPEKQLQWSDRVERVSE